MRLSHHPPPQNLAEEHIACKISDKHRDCSTSIATPTIPSMACPTDNKLIWHSLEYNMCKFHRALGLVFEDSIMIPGNLRVRKRVW